jgi:hypothetical protein
MLRNASEEEHSGEELFAPQIALCKAPYKYVTKEKITNYQLANPDAPVHIFVEGVKSELGGKFKSPGTAKTTIQQLFTSNGLSKISSHLDPYHERKLMYGAQLENIELLTKMDEALKDNAEWNFLMPGQVVQSYDILINPAAGAAPASPDTVEDALIEMVPSMNPSDVHVISPQGSKSVFWSVTYTSVTPIGDFMTIPKDDLQFIADNGEPIEIDERHLSNSNMYDLDTLLAIKADKKEPHDKAVARAVAAINDVDARVWAVENPMAPSGHKGLIYATFPTPYQGAQAKCRLDEEKMKYTSLLQSMPDSAVFNILDTMPASKPNRKRAEKGHVSYAAAHLAEIQAARQRAAEVDATAATPMPPADPIKNAQLKAGAKATNVKPKKEATPKKTTKKRDSPATVEEIAPAAKKVRTSPMRSVKK